MTAKARANWRIKQLRADKFKGWTIRKLKNLNSGAIIWQSDNCKEPPNRERLSWETEDKAKKHVEEKATEEKNHGLAAYDFPHEERVEIKKVTEKLPPGVLLVDLLNFYKRHNPDSEGVSLKDGHARWMAAQEKDEMRPTTIRQNKQRGSVFVGAMGPDTPCAAVTPDRVRRFIEGRKCGKATRKSWEKTLRAFFSYAVEMKWCDTNPIPPKRRKRGGGGDLGRKIPGFMPPNTVERLLHKAEEMHPAIVPALAVMFFAGLRPFEVSAQYRLKSDKRSEVRKAVSVARLAFKKVKKQGGEAAADAFRKLNEARRAADKVYESDPATLGGLDWSNVNLAERFIRVLPETSKTGAGRLVDISDNLLIWLAKYRKASGPVAPSPMSLIRYRREVMKKAGVKKWLPDVARHSYATMHFAMWQDQDKLQAMMGHSGKAYILTAHYKGLATKGEAEKFWGIEPKDSAQGERTLQLATAGA